MAFTKDGYYVCAENMEEEKVYIESPKGIVYQSSPQCRCHSCACVKCRYHIEQLRGNYTESILPEISLYE